jgi:phage terminase large subunit
MLEHGVDPNDLSYWDSAEPKSIDELRIMGFNALPCEKGPDSVRAGLDFVRACKVHMVTGRCPNLKSEMLQYHWREDKKGNPLNEPVKFKDHLMSAARYGIATHLKEAGAYLGVFDFDIRPA